MIYLACSIVSIFGLGFLAGMWLMAWFDDQLEPRS